MNDNSKARQKLETSPEQPLLEKIGSLVKEHKHAYAEIEHLQTKATLKQYAQQLYKFDRMFIRDKDKEITQQLGLSYLKKKTTNKLREVLKVTSIPLKILFANRRPEAYCWCKQRNNNK